MLNLIYLYASLDATPFRSAHQPRQEVGAMPVRVGVIAVGGQGMHFGRNDIQKCLVSIEGKPILEYVLQTFAGANLKLIFLLTGFLQDQVNSYLTGSLGLINDCVVTSLFGGIEGEAPVISRLRPFLEEDFLYAGGDVIPTPETVGSSEMRQRLVGS